MKISASEVNKLRKSTGSGMMDCKKALEESGGDYEKAIEILRKKGQKVAANRADRESSEGVVLAKVNSDKTSGIIISVNCETDFVARNQDYLKLANDLSDHALSFDTLENFLSSKFNDMPVSDKLLEQTGIIGEKIELGTFKKLTAPFVGHYIHNGNKIASLIGLSGIIKDAEEISKNISMQVAAMNPIALDEKSVPIDILEKEIEIAKDQLRKEGKPEEMLEKISQGKMKRFFRDNTLINQSYIKDNSLSVSDYLKLSDPDLRITDFKRFSLI
ncbi:MAG: translation elongation factor Ts [Bacteroidota bacterium]|nr:translation elongation factor Ts [Bacteroidota bacterium]